jgi:hypothetical protein
MNWNPWWRHRPTCSRLPDADEDNALINKLNFSYGTHNKNDDVIGCNAHTYILFNLHNSIYNKIIFMIIFSFWLSR